MIKKSLGQIRFQCPFLVPYTSCFKMHILMFLKGVNNFEIEHETCLFLIRGLYPLKILLLIMELEVFLALCFDIDHMK